MRVFGAIIYGNGLLLGVWFDTDGEMSLGKPQLNGLENGAVLCAQ